MKTKSLLVLSLALLGGAHRPLSAQEPPPDARQLLQAAHQATDPAALLPYELRATVVINPNTENEKRGTLAITRDHGRSKTELAVENYQETKVVRDNKLYVFRSTPMPIPQLGQLAETDHSWDKLSESADGKLGDVSRKKAQNQPAECFDVKEPQRQRLCFDPARKVLLETLDRQRATEFTNYVAAEGHLFPGKITVLLELERMEKPVLVLEDIKIQRVQNADAAFSVPPGAAVFDTCENIEAAKPVQSPTPEFSMTAMRRNAGQPAISVYGIVDKDGNLEHVKVLTGDVEVKDTILETVKKWRYKPAMCGATPVASEKEFQVFIFRGDSGGDSQGGRRGR